jgi:hypothetical protein
VSDDVYPGLADPAAAQAAVRRLGAAPPLKQDLPAPYGFVLLAQLQLALRHPNNRGGAARITRQIAEQLEAAIVERVPELAALCAAGWDRDAAVPWPVRGSEK